MQVLRSVREISLPNFCSALDRANISSRFGGLLATTLVKDFNIPNIVIGRHKIEYERAKSRAASLKW